jgi:hypothetical protein
MDVNTHSRNTTVNRGSAGKLDGYTLHPLKLDGTVVTVGKNRRDAKLTVEVRDHRGERRIPVKLARSSRAAKLARAVGETKDELLQRTRRGEPN